MNWKFSQSFATVPSAPLVEAGSKQNQRCKFWKSVQTHLRQIKPIKRIQEIRLDPLQPIRQWIDHIEIQDQKLARFFSKTIPAQCPFERDIKFFGQTVVHIPPLCKLNPLYHELVALRFRALCYLVDQCGEDIQPYC